MFYSISNIKRNKNFGQHFNFLQKDVKAHLSLLSKIIPHLLATKSEPGQGSWSLRLSHSSQWNFKPCLETQQVRHTFILFFGLFQHSRLLKWRWSTFSPSTRKTCMQWIYFPALEEAFSESTGFCGWELLASNVWSVIIKHDFFLSCK